MSICHELKLKIYPNLLNNGEYEVLFDIVDSNENIVYVFSLNATKIIEKNGFIYTESDGCDFLEKIGDLLDSIENS